MTADIEVWVQDTSDTPCQACIATTGYLDRNNIPYEKRNLSEATKAELDDFRQLGTTAPVVLTKHYGDFSGLRPDKLRAIKKGHQANRPSSSSNAAPTIPQLMPVQGASGVSM